MTTISNQIRFRISEFQTEKVFIASDFIDLADISTVWQVLSREEKDGTIKRIFQGFYYKPEYSALLDEYEAPSPHEVALAIARKYGWNIAPSENSALNMLGLSTQVPAKWTYVSDGPYRKIKLDNIDIEFKHRNNREITGLSYKTSLIIQAIKAIGRDKLDDNAIMRFSSILTEEEKAWMLEEAKYVTAWVYGVIKQICRSLN